MTKDETGKIVAAITATYPNHYANFTPEKINTLILAWTAVFNDYDYVRVNDGLLRYIKSDTKGFPPSPGQIIANMPSEYAYYMKRWIEVEDKKHYIERH